MVATMHTTHMPTPFSRAPKHPLTMHVPLIFIPRGCRHSLFTATPRYRRPPAMPACPGFRLPSARFCFRQRLPPAPPPAPPLVCSPPPTGSPRRTTTRRSPTITCSHDIIYDNIGDWVADDFRASGWQDKMALSRLRVCLSMLVRLGYC